MGQSIQRNNGVRQSEELSAGLAIEARELTKRYGGGGGVSDASGPSVATVALDHVNLAVPAGAIHGVLGASGAGKTTLLRILAGLEQPDSGQVAIAGRIWSGLNERKLREERQQIGVVFQHLHLMLSRTVAANVALPLEFVGTSRSVIRERVQELLGWFDIAEKADAYPARLSGGQRQRVALARALATSPAVLLADEPTSALDPETKSSVIEVLRRIRDELGVTILVITHDITAAADLCDSVTVLDKGRVAETGSVRQVLERPQSAATRRLLTHRVSPALSVESSWRPGHAWHPELEQA
ncbi:methionine ABC transporter ATP-binding protein [Acidicapsa ligni]|uniref:methionine ABC transporter ATP-binding protein n=1 Tax=Acidicapsa ligni TaxID=542300 RepID=UPI0021E035A2|nr:ATP-binding cassette domain-containing protein [Acidicapsa ligni]